MDKIKFGIIGCGRIAARHAKHIGRLGILVAVCDTIAEKAHQLAVTHNAKAYTAIEDLLSNEESIDVIAICTPNGLHAAHSIQALQVGFHVLVEKPMAITVQDCEAMIAAAASTNKFLFAIKQNRFNPPVAAVKEAIDKGILGKIYSLQLSCFWNRDEAYYQNSWKGTKDMDGGTLFTQFSHFIDLLYWMNGDVKKVFALTGNFAHKGVIDFEDTGVVAMEFCNGSIGTINYTVNSHQQNMEGSLTIFAEKGTVKIGGQYLNELAYQNIEGFQFENLPKGNDANNYGTYIGSMSNHDKVYENVIDVLQNGAIMATSAFDALKTVEIIHKIYDAAHC
ncbi:Gfo/Idh/MocA family protein [Parasediminibacterium sp. JCM 36343]|uniref:Gfo/Idh/MocA family protein n=1 Tax=Parasediminibacterium sp. JCM 36343 TaxID=3374279 RepID=UPI00397B2C23